MATRPMSRRTEVVAHNQKKTTKPRLVLAARKIAAGEFKAKCLAIIDEVNRTGQEVVITKRGNAAAKLVPFRESQKSNKSFIGRLEGIIEIIGDPDDLIKPVFPEHDWDMLK